MLSFNFLSSNVIPCVVATFSISHQTGICCCFFFKFHLFKCLQLLSISIYCKKFIDVLILSHNSIAHLYYPIFCSKPWIYEPKSSSWLFHDSKIFLWAPFESDSTANWTEAMEISHVSDIVTVHPVNFSWSNAYNFSLVRVNGPGSSILIFDVNLRNRMH